MGAERTPKRRRIPAQGLLAALQIATSGCAGDEASTSDASAATSIGSISSAGTGTGTGGETSGGESSSDASDGSSGDATGLTGDPECGAGEGPGDQDGDGIADADDDCPCEDNPNQRDFDGDGRGNACDNPLLFSKAEGGSPINVLKTTVEASVTSVVLGQEVTASCVFDIDMVVASGESLIKVRDQGRADLWYANLHFADTGERMCEMTAAGITVVRLKVRLDDIVLESALPWQVGFAYSGADHDAGVLAGATDAAQDMAISGTFVVLESDNETLSKPGNTELRAVPGRFALAAIKVEDHGARLISTWSDPEFVVFDQVVSASGVRVRLLGMEGVLRMIY